MDKKLSQWMREGSALVPQVKESYLLYMDGRCSGACALGAAILAEKPFLIVGTSDFSIPLSKSQVFNHVERTPYVHPITGDTLSLYLIITDLNDCRDWTREAIADWLESIGE